MLRIPRRLLVSIATVSLVAACGGGGGGSDGGADLADTTEDGSGDFDAQPEVGGDASPDVPVLDVDPSDTTDGASDTEDVQEEVEATCEDAARPFGCACDFNVDCISGWCIQAETGTAASTCTQLCGDESCPEGFGCTQVAGAGDPVFICVPEIQFVCEPCAEHDDCGGFDDLCLEIDGGLHCAQDCTDPDRPCPEGFTCQDVEDGDGFLLGKQCLPDNGSCTCGPEVDLQTDPDNCGTCQRVCTFDHGLAACEGGDCVLDGCEEGWIDLNEAPSDGCEYECTWTSETDLPDPLAEDANCDGIDGEISRAVFVAPWGSASAAGTRDDPFDTIVRGISKAPGMERDHVYVAAGSYTDPVVAANGVSVYGGYGEEGWVRDPDIHETIVSVDTPDGSGPLRAVVMEDLDLATVFGGLTIQAGNNTNPGGSSYGVWMRNVTADVQLVNCRVVGGNGGAGAQGNGGSKGSDGAKGQNGTQGSTDCKCNEHETFGGKGGAPGPSTCGGVGAGGKGADGSCGSDDAGAGSPSPDGTPGGGAEQKGSDGADGGDGAHGAGGKAGGDVTAQGLWRGDGGEVGVPGGDGLGGGGGGGGDGRKTGLWHECTLTFSGDGIWGGGGGGGGSGGCGGTPGQPGGAGGGSFGVFVADGNPTLVDNVLSHKSGGNGGNGGIGGGGGFGKAGGTGGGGEDGSGAGGAGGHGGDGGRGGHGGGGAGGVAYALYLAGTSAPSCEGNTYEPLGAGGIGGIGGALEGHKGAKGEHDASNASSDCF